jgi:hypothetical protein
MQRRSDVFRSKGQLRTSGPGQKHGNYLVRSAYRLLVEKASQEEEHSQGNPSHSECKEQLGVEEIMALQGATEGQGFLVESVQRVYSVSG